MRRLLPLLLLSALTGCGLVGHQFRHLTGSPAARLADDVTIERDSWGVPHVHARSAPAALFGLAYAMAEDNYWQIEEDYLQQLGWSAHYYGERYLADDLLRAALGVRAQARAEYERQPEQLRQLWSAFAEGLNYYLDTHPAAPRRLLVHYEPWMVFARAATGARAAHEVNGIRLGEIASTIGAAAAGALPVVEVTARSRARAVPPGEGDNAHALLLAVTAGPFHGHGQRYEARLSTLDGWHFDGVAELGLPVFLAGHNAAAAWALLGARDSLLLHPLQFTDSLTYRYAGRSFVAEVVSDTLNVNTATGVVRRSYAFLRTPHGPVIARRGDTAYALEPLPRHGLAESWHLMQATSLATFRSALVRASAAYADTTGAVAYVGASAADALGGHAATVAELVRLAFHVPLGDVRAELAMLVDEWERIGGTNPQRALALDTAIERLRAWPGELTAESREAVLYLAWQEELRQPGYEQGYGRFRALESVVARVQRAAGGKDVAWGELNRLQRRHTSGLQAFSDSLPSVPAGFALHTVRGPGVRQYAVSGPAWVGVFELRVPPRLESIVPFGQSADSASAHWFDQAERYARGELKARGDVRERYRPGRRAQGVQAETAGRRQP